ncbi:MAG: hypothetical protein AAGD18_21540 [Actinomycetota bacterium]
MAGSIPAPSVSVLVCHGCCCGTERKHPDVDHDGHRAHLAEAAERAGGRLRTVDCVGPCERSNVVIVRRGSERHWFGELRHDDEIERLGEWIAAGADGPLGGLARHRFPKPVPPAERRMLPEWGPELAERCIERIAAGGAWTMGVHGALAEFHTEAGVEIVDTPAGDGHLIEARSASGAMRLTIDASTRAFAFERDDQSEVELLVRRGTSLVTNTGLAELGPDRSPLFDEEAGQTIFDLGLGDMAAQFGIRTGDRDLVAVLRRQVGTPLVDIGTDVFAAIVAASPTRVVTTALGRIEVTAPIPPPDGESPHGSHTHLRPDDLALGLDLPHEMEVPSGWHLGPIHYPATVGTAA